MSPDARIEALMGAPKNGWAALSEDEERLVAYGSTYDEVVQKAEESGLSEPVVVKVNEPKTRRSKAPIPLWKELAEALEAHRERAGILAQPELPIFQAGNGQPLNLDNLSRRVIGPSIELCKTCGKVESEHLPEGHMFELDKTIEWHGWHAFRRGLATNLHALGVDNKTIQAILRHSNVGLTMNVYVKSVSELQVNAMDALGEKLAKCNVHATSVAGR